MKKEFNPETIPKERDTVFVGDIHGNLEHIVWEICSRFSLTDTDVIFCGDFGVGFGSKEGMNILYKSIEPKLEKSRNKFWVLRGNHDDPDYFDGTHNYPLLVFLQDHVPVEINGWSIYPVGGGTSIDRSLRIPENLKYIKYGSQKRVWWPGERIIKKFIGLPPKVDIVISHEAPMDFDPILIKKDGLMMTGEIIDNIKVDRNYLGWLLRELHPKRWFHGHYHRSTSGDYLGCLYRGLAIDEIFMLPKKSEEINERNTLL